MYWLWNYLHFSLALLAICMPQSAIPIFMNLTRGLGRKEKTNIAKTVMFTVFCVLAVAALGGSQILKSFGISLDSFRFIGGIMLLSLSLGMLKGQQKRHTDDEEEEAAERSAIGIVPLGMPILAGPGAISTVIIEAQSDPSPMHFAVVIASAATVAAVCFLCLNLSEKLGALLGQTGLNIITRVFGMLVGALAIEFMYSSLAHMFPAWTIAS